MFESMLMETLDLFILITLVVFSHLFNIRSVADGRNVYLFDSNFINAFAHEAITESDIRSRVTRL